MKLQIISIFILAILAHNVSTAITCNAACETCDFATQKCTSCLAKSGKSDGACLGTNATNCRTGTYDAGNTRIKCVTCPTGKTPKAADGTCENTTGGITGCAIHGVDKTKNCLQCTSNTEVPKTGANAGAADVCTALGGKTKIVGCEADAHRLTNAGVLNCTQCVTTKFLKADKTACEAVANQVPKGCIVQGADAGTCAICDTAANFFSYPIYGKIKCVATAGTDPNTYNGCNAACATCASGKCTSCVGKAAQWDGSCTNANGNTCRTGVWGDKGAVCATCPTGKTVKAADGTCETAAGGITGCAIHGLDKTKNCLQCTSNTEVPKTGANAGAADVCTALGGKTKIVGCAADAHRLTNAGVLNCTQCATTKFTKTDLTACTDVATQVPKGCVVQGAAADICKVCDVAANFYAKNFTG